jgi:hypothetical protein
MLAMTKITQLAASTAMLAALMAASPARAMDQFEIQVYEAEVNKPWQPGIELHTNYTFKGQKQPAYPGQVPPHHAARFTLEPALGVTDFFELGMYLQGMVAPGEGALWGGVKFRGKFVVPERFKWPLFLGVNVEIGKVPDRVEEDGWANEFRPIIGYRNGWVLLDVNPIIGYALSGEDRFKPDFEPAGKVAVNTQLGFQLGVEYYASLGHFKEGLSPWRKQEHLVFGVFDLAHPAGYVEKEGEGEWELNVAVGRGLTDGTGPEWIAKSIVGRSF